MTFVIGAREAVEDPTVVTCTFLINNLYAKILFDTGADRSYITHDFRKLLDYPSSKLREAYKVEMDNDQASSVREILRNCTLTIKILIPFSSNLC